MIFIEQQKPKTNIKFFTLTIKETLRDYDIECEDFKIEYTGSALCFEKKEDFELFKLYIHIINNKKYIDSHKNIWLWFKDRYDEQINNSFEECYEKYEDEELDKNNEYYVIRI